jgi:hypothetical protein
LVAMLFCQPCVRSAMGWPVVWANWFISESAKRQVRNHRLKAVALVTAISPVPARGRQDECRTKRASRSRWTQPSTLKA